MTPKEFENHLGEQQDKLPFTDGVDDGRYNDGQLDGFENGARWCYKAHVEPLQKENERLKDENDFFKLQIEGFKKASKDTSPF